ncbi:MAG: YaiO family outer membrane beta-barrel protein [Sulfuriferula sp.]
MIEFKKICVYLASAALSLPVAPFALAAPAKGYGHDIRAISRALQTQQNELANRLAQQLRKKHPGNPEVTAIWLRLQCAQGQFQGYQQLSLQERNSRYPELQKVLQSCSQNMTLTQAQHLLDAGDAVGAIGLAKPLYLLGPDSYRAGLILAKAYMVNLQTEQAQQIYAAMAQRYPKDTGLATQARLLESDLALTQAQHLLDSNDTMGAINIAEPLYTSGPDSYRAGLILAKAYRASHQTDQAQQIYAAMAQRYPKDTGLATQAQLLESDLVLTQAQHLLDDGNATGAINIAEPLYTSGPDSYRAGLILAKAYRANHQADQAQQVYAAMAQRYPKDTDFAVQSVILLAQDHHSRQAQQAFSRLSAQQQRPVLAALAGDTRALYPMAVTVSGSVASSTGNLPNDHNLGLQLRMDTHLGTVVGTINQARRFGQSATAYGVHLYRTLGNGYSGEVAVTYSPSGTFLARESITLALSKELGSLSLEGSVRHLVFNNTVANVLFAGVSFPINATFNLRTGVFYVPETNAYSLMFNPVWQNADGGRTFAYLTGGMAGEQLGIASSVVKTPTYSIKIGRVLNIRPDVALMLDAFYEHRAALYNRSGLEFAVTKRW